MKWMMMTLGTGIGGVAGFIEYKRRQSMKQMDVTKVNPASGNGVVEKPLLTVNGVQMPPSVDRN